MKIRKSLFATTTITNSTGLLHLFGLSVKDLSTEPDDCIYLAVKMRKESDKSHPEFALLQLLRI